MRWEWNKLNCSHRISFRINQIQRIDSSKLFSFLLPFCQLLYHWSILPNTVCRARRRISGSGEQLDVCIFKQSVTKDQIRYRNFLWVRNVTRFGVRRNPSLPGDHFNGSHWLELVELLRLQPFRPKPCAKNFIHHFIHLDECYVMMSHGSRLKFHGRNTLLWKTNYVYFKQPPQVVWRGTA